MAIAATAALVSTGVGVATVGAAGLSFATVFGATTAFGMMATHFLITTAIGAALNSLAPKPNIAAAQGGYNITTTSPIADHQVIYGQVKAGGVRVFDGTDGDENDTLHRVLAFTGHEIEEFSTIYINDEPVVLDSEGNVLEPIKYSGLVKINQHLGTTDQAADTDLVSAISDWTLDHRLQGIAYLYVRLTYDKEVFVNGVPEITAVIKGKKVYDPRTGTTAWSDNPALCVRDYLTSKTYGLGESIDNIDDDSFSLAANVCQYYNYPSLSGNKRYTINGNFTTAASPYDLLQSILSSMGGMLWYSQGFWRTKPAYWTDPTVSFDENDLRSSISVTTRHSRRDNFNTVNGTWRGEESNWQTTDFPPVTNGSFVSADNGEEVTRDLTLAFTSDVDMARRIANIYLERNRQQLTVQASFGMRAFQVQVGDNITLTNSRFGWYNKAFEVVSWTFGLGGGNDLQVQMVLRETSETAFDDVSDGAIYERNRPNLPSPFYVQPVGIEVVAKAQISNQKVSNIAEINVRSSSSGGINYVEVEYRKTGDELWTSVGTGPVGYFEAVDLEVGRYDFRARAVNVFDVKGEWDTIYNKEINAFIGDPSDVGSVDFEASGGTLFFSWPAVPDPDLSHYVIKHNSQTTGATWGNSTTIVEKIPRPATSVTVPARSGTYLIKAYDKEDNFSVNATQVVVPPSDIPQLGVTYNQTEHPSFSGTGVNVTVVNNKLEIDDTSTLVNGLVTGTYYFSDIIDTGSARSCRVTGSRVFSRSYDDSQMLWDDIPKLWDVWPDTWDTWTDEGANWGDISVVVYVQATNDDPAGSPTWGPLLLANGSFYTGRAFKFTAVLTCSNPDFTPSVSELSVDVEF